AEPIMRRACTRRRRASNHLSPGPWLSRNYAAGMNGDRSRLGCCSARPRAEHRCLRTHQTVNGFTCVEWPARARPTAPEAGALPKTTALFRFRVGLLSPTLSSCGEERENISSGQVVVSSKLPD